MWPQVSQELLPAAVAWEEVSVYEKGLPTSGDLDVVLNATCGGENRLAGKDNLVGRLPWPVMIVEQA
jgi:hypothetical protein